MIQILWCTANPEVFMKTHEHWMNTAVKPEQIQTKVAVDTEEHKELLKDYDVVQVYNPRHGFTTPLYALSSNLHLDVRDIIVVPSDDFYSPVNWDVYLTRQFDDFDGYFKVNDGHMKDIISIPVMNFAGLLKTNKIIYHPAYTHMFSDQELHDIVENLGAMKVASPTEPEFEHKHYVYKKREMLESDKRVINYWDESYHLYLQRKKLNIEQRLTI